MENWFLSGLYLKKTANLLRINLEKRLLPIKKINTFLGAAKWFFFVEIAQLHVQQKVKQKLTKKFA